MKFGPIAILGPASSRLARTSWVLPRSARHARGKMPVEPNRFGQVSVYLREADARRHKRSGEHVTVVETSEAQRNVGFTRFEADRTKTVATSTSSAGCYDARPLTWPRAS